MYECMYAPPGYVRACIFSLSLGLKVGWPHLTSFQTLFSMVSHYVPLLVAVQLKQLC